MRDVGGLISYFNSFPDMYSNVSCDSIPHQAQHVPHTDVAACPRIKEETATFCGLLLPSLTPCVELMGNDLDGLVQSDRGLQNMWVGSPENCVSLTR